MHSSIRNFENYEILECLGQGGMCRVYKGRHTTLGTIVAIKTLNDSDDLAKDAPLLKREAQAASKLHHPNIARPLTFGIADGQPFIVYEYAEGRSLEQLIKEGHKF